MKYSKYLRALHSLTNEIGNYSEVDTRYFEIHDHLVEILELAEELGLITEESDLTGEPN